MRRAAAFLWSVGAGAAFGLAMAGLNGAIGGAGVGAVLWLAGEWK